MVTKLCAGHRMGRNTAFLFGSLQISKSFGDYVRAVSHVGAPEGASFEACSRRRYSICRWLAAQIFENLVGCSKEELVSTLSKTGAIITLHVQMRV